MISQCESIRSKDWLSDVNERRETATGSAENFPNFRPVQLLQRVQFLSSILIRKKQFKTLRMTQLTGTLHLVRDR